MSHERTPITIPGAVMRYTDHRHLTLIHRIDGDSGEDSIEVVGDPDNASYEWVVRCGDEIKHSDCGYGMASIALRDALIEYHGDRTNETASARTIKVRG